MVAGHLLKPPPSVGGDGDLPSWPLRPYHRAAPVIKTNKSPGGSVEDGFADRRDLSGYLRGPFADRLQNAPSRRIACWTVECRAPGHAAADATPERQLHRSAGRVTRIRRALGGRTPADHSSVSPPGDRSILPPAAPDRNGTSSQSVGRCRPEIVIPAVIGNR